MNNNPLIIPLDNEANTLQSDQINRDNQNSESLSQQEYPSPISTDSIPSPIQGTSSTQESLSELSSNDQSANRKQSSSEEEPQSEFNQKNIVNSQPITEDTFSKEISNVEDNKKTTSSDVEKVKPSLCRSDAFGLSVQSTSCDNSTTPKTTATADSIDSAVDSENNKNIYHVKWIEFGLRNCAIITQNENGPCPLISIINVLLLRGEMSLPNETEVVSSEQLLQYLADLVLTSQDDDSHEKAGDKKDPNVERNLNDSIAVLPRLATGLDVNVRFTGISDFEFTPELLIFDVLNINLYHGWLVDPQTEDVGLAVGGATYNQLVEKIITNRLSNDSVLYSQSLLAEQFLEESASQLTYHGLYELNTRIKDQTLGVFFRNNHFSTIFKKNGELFILVTDQGYLNQGDVVWETLANIEGDCHFVNHLFQTSGVDERLQGKDLPQDSVERDRYLAETLQREGEEATQRESLFQMFKNKHFGDSNRELTDEELAKKLQEVENRAAQEMERRNQEQHEQSTSADLPGAPRPQNPIGPRKNKNKDCSIL